MTGQQQQQQQHFCIYRPYGSASYAIGKKYFSSFVKMTTIWAHCDDVPAHLHACLDVHMAHEKIKNVVQGLSRPCIFTEALVRLRAKSYISFTVLS